MKNLIYLDNSREIISANIKYEKQLLKLSNDKKIDINKLTSKFLDIQKLLSNIYNIEKDYELVVTATYQKILTIILLEICKNYIQSTKTKPHIILSYNESNFITNLCKKLVKSNILDSITILKEFDIINDFKLKKQSNTLLAFVSNINNNLLYDLTKLSSFCKYYNIILISNIENVIYNYVYNNSSISNNNSFLNLQDIISINYYEQKNKIYILLLKKTFLHKYKINQIDNLFKPFISNESIIYLINVISYYNTYDLLYNKVFSLFNEFVTLLNKEYKIINYNDFQKTQDIYFTNSTTIILLNNINYTNFLLNNIILSIYIPDSKFSNNQLLDYLKANSIITNTTFKLPNILSKNILNGLIAINFSYMTKIQDIKKIIKIIDNFINLKINKTISIKKKKHIQFSNPEFSILSKPFHTKNKKPLKGILKK